MAFASFKGSTNYGLIQGFLKGFKKDLPGDRFGLKFFRI